MFSSSRSGYDTKVLALHEQVSTEAVWWRHYLPCLHICSWQKLLCNAKFSLQCQHIFEQSSWERNVKRQLWGQTKLLLSATTFSDRWWKEFIFLSLGWVWQFLSFQTLKKRYSLSHLWDYIMYKLKRKIKVTKESCAKQCYIDAEFISF